MSDTLRQYILDYLRSGKTKMMQLATEKNGQPWVCTMYYAYDDKLSFYWVTSQETRHSQEIQHNPKVAIAIAHDQQPPTDKHVGLQAEGVAELLRGEDDINMALDLYADQLKSDQNWINEIKNYTDSHKIYRLAPSRIVLFDDTNFPNSPRQELSL